MHPGTHAVRSPSKPAIVGTSGRVISYRDLEEGSNRIAHLFRSLGLARGDRVAMVIDNRPEFLVATWAAQRSGLYYAPCSTRLTPEEVDHILQSSHARVLLASPTEATRLATLATSTVERRYVVGAGPVPAGWEHLDEAIRDLPTVPITDQAEGDALLYSSGTTGRPKGVRRSLPEGPYPQLGVAGDFGALFGVDESAVYLAPAPLYHAAPLFFALMVHRLGGTIVVQERFDAEGFLRLIEEQQVTFSQVVPTMFVRLLELPEEVRTRYDLSSLRGMVHTAAPCPIPIKEAMIEWLGPIVHEYYTGTERAGFVYCSSEEWMAHRGTVGRSLTGPLHVLDDAGNELPPGERGLVYFDGAGFEYEGDTAKTQESRDPADRGWSTLGDIGYLDEAGYLYLTDRKAYTIISGGVNVYPREAEDVLIMHPAVADVAVFGIPDREMGESVHAVVQLQPSASGSDDLVEELKAYCRERLASFKCPRSVEFRVELPRHQTGKLYKRLLRDEHWSDTTLTS